jgi:hypothetical protein
MHKILQTTPQQPSRDKRSGAALVLISLFLLLLVPIMGLAVDGANVYIMNNQITTSMQASVLAGTRNLNVGSNVTAQRAFALTVANNTWNANIAGMSNLIVWNSLSFQVIPDDVNHYQSVTGSVSATLPLLLMPVLGVNTATAPVTATAKKRDVNLMLILDNSGAMGDNLAYGVPLSDMQSAAIAFVNTFTEGRDNVGLVAMSTAPYVTDTLPSPSSGFKTNLTASINSLNDPNGLSPHGYPNASAAIWAAYQQLQALNEPGALNVIVFFTNALPGAFTGTWDSTMIRYDPANPYAYTPSCSTTPVTGTLFADQYAQEEPTGLGSPTAASVTDWSEYNNPPQCDGVYYNPGATADGSLLAMPAFDVNGNSTNGTGSIGLYTPVTLLQNAQGISGPNIIAASSNAFDDAANRIRSDATLKPVICTIALAGDYYIYPDPDLMARVANDQTYVPVSHAVSYNSTQAAGHYVQVTQTSALAAAFASVASSILQLTR